MSKFFKRVLLSSWVVVTLYLIYLQHDLAFPSHAFVALFRLEYLFFLFLDIALAVVISVGMFRFTVNIKTVLLFIVVVACPLSLGVAFYQHTPLKSGFSYSKNALTESLSNGQPGDICGLYTVTDHVQRAEHTIIFIRGNRDSYSPCGFIKFADPTIKPTTDSMKLPDAGFFALGDGWYVFYSYYDSIKLGWS